VPPPLLLDPELLLDPPLELPELEPLELPELEPLDPPLLDPLELELPLPPGHVVPPGSQPVPQLTVWQW
jgi:hypothetical protein